MRPVNEISEENIYHRLAVGRQHRLAAHQLCVRGASWHAQRLGLFKFRELRSKMQGGAQV